MNESFKIMNFNKKASVTGFLQLVNLHCKCTEVHFIFSSSMIFEITVLYFIYYNVYGHIQHDIGNIGVDNHITKETGTCLFIFFFLHN